MVRFLFFFLRLAVVGVVRLGIFGATSAATGDDGLDGWTFFGKYTLFWSNLSSDTHSSNRLLTVDKQL